MIWEAQIWKLVYVLDLDNWRKQLMHSNLTVIHTIPGVVALCDLVIKIDKVERPE